MSSLTSDTFLKCGKAILMAVFTTSVFFYYRAFSKASQTEDFPSIDGNDCAYGKEFCSAIEKGTKQYPNSIFKLKTSNYETIILPHRYINEIKRMPEKYLSLGMELYERQLGRFTLIGTVGRAIEFVNSIRIDLNKHLVETLPPLLAETEYVVQHSIGHCTEWKPVHVHSQSLRMVALLTGRVFVGTRLSRNEEWIKCSIQTTVDTFTAAFLLWKIPSVLRPVVAIFLPHIWSIHFQNWKISKLLKPCLDERLKQMEDPSFKRPCDMLQFFLENVPTKDASYQAKLHAAINVAAIHTTSMNITHILYDLAAYPEHVEPLREEFNRAFLETGGVIDKNFIIKLRKLDSFMRESQRLSPPGVVSMSRRVQCDMRLSDGAFLPKGCLIACDSWSATRDSELWEDPEKFDGFRFERLRSIPGNEAKYQFITTSSTNMAFGHGAHSCPGRFFVANEIKILISHIIRHYDIKLEAGSRRPESSYNNIMILPNTEAKLLFKSRGEV